MYLLKQLRISELIMAECGIDMQSVASFCMLFLFLKIFDSAFEVTCYELCRFLKPSDGDAITLDSIH